MDLWVRISLCSGVSRGLGISDEPNNHETATASRADCRLHNAGGPEKQCKEAKKKPIGR